MGKTALFAIAAFTVMGAYYGLSTSQGMIGTSDRIAEHQYEVLARNAALAGYNLAKQRLVSNFAGQTMQGTYGGAQYSVGVTTSGSIATVTSDGTMSGAAGTGTYKIVARLEREQIVRIADEAPAFMQYAILSEQDLTLNGNLSIDTVRVEGTEAAKFNANVHTNGQLRVEGNSAKIKGFGTYKTTQNVQHTGVFQPYINPAREAVIQRVSTGVKIPLIFDAEAMAAKAQTQLGGVDATAPGDVTLNGTYDFAALGATRENPYIWHVKGNLTASGNTVLNGYVMFLVNGNIDFTGNMRQGTHTGRSENRAAFYSNGTIRVAGTVSLLWGQLFGRGGVTLSGTSELYGNITSAGSVTINGTPRIKYYPPSPALTTIWQDPETRLKLISYAER